MFRPFLRSFPSSLQRAQGTTHQPSGSGAALVPARCLSSLLVASAPSPSAAASTWYPLGLSGQRRKQQDARQPHNNLSQRQHETFSFQVRFRSNRSRRGLYDGKDIRSGNNVSFSMKATKRTFKPNVFLKRVYSSVLDQMIPFHLTASTLRSIDKAGGLDHYLLTNASIVEGEGQAVRKKILSRLRNQTRMARKEAERAAAASSSSVEAGPGLTPPSEATGSIP